MAQDSNFALVAKRAGVSDFDIFAAGCLIGRLADCEVCHVFVSDDEMLAGYVEARTQGGDTFRQTLAAVRAGYEAFCAAMASEVASEQQAEGAWLRAAEYAPDQLAETEAEDRQAGLQ